MPKSVVKSNFYKYSLLKFNNKLSNHTYSKYLLKKLFFLKKNNTFFKFLKNYSF